MKLQVLYRILVVFSLFVSSNTYSQSVDSSLLKLNECFISIYDNYVDSVESQKMAEDAIKGMLKKLDPHSNYLSKKQLQKANEPLLGNFEGIGIQFNVLNDTVVVIAPISGGPSEKLGIRSGDKIVKVDDSLFVGEHITSSKVVKTLRGKKGTIVKVSIFRRGESELLDFNIVRDKIPIFSVDAHFMITDDIGYIKINRFARTTLREYYIALRNLKEKGMNSLVIDLRGNSGGYLNVAIDLADEFLSEGKVIVYTEGNNSPRSEYKSTYRGQMKKGKVAVLIDEGSASASEILSGAIQDWDRGIVIGRRSFGKGLVQKPFALPDGSAIRLTIARYYTPTGRCIQKPYDEGTDDYHKDLMKRFNSGELSNKDSIKFPDSLKYYTSNNRVVYGGGGIMPDIFIPLDTNRTTKYYSELVRKGILNSFVLNYIDNNREDLKKKYPNIKTYKSEMIVTKNFYKDLVTIISDL